MGTLSVFWRYALWLTAPLLFLSVVLLVVCILGVVRLVKRSHILSVPVVGEQTIEFFGSGPVVLCLEGPRFTTKFAWLKYRLAGADGVEVPGRRAWFRARTSGVSTVRMELRRYTIPEPGQYVLYVDGLKEGEDASGEEDTSHHLVFMRPHLARMVGYIVGITLSGCAFISSLVFSLLKLLEHPGAH